MICCVARMQWSCYVRISWAILLMAISVFFFLKAIRLVRSICSKRSLTCLVKATTFFLRSERSVPHFRFGALNLPLQNPLRQKASEHEPKPKKGQGRQELELNPHYLVSFKRNNGSPPFQYSPHLIKLGNFLRRLPAALRVLSWQIDFPRPPHTILPVKSSDAPARSQNFKFFAQAKACSPDSSSKVSDLKPNFKG